VIAQGNALGLGKSAISDFRSTTMTPDPFHDVLILSGPTASGKSELALALAERVGAEIVCMDSMTLYRGMDVGTAKPTAEDRRRVPHHLLDVLDPWESASVAWWLRRAAECCRDIAARGRRAILVGGTPLYLKAVLSGLFDGPPADEALRRGLEKEAQRLGPAVLHGRLAAIDPRSARRLHANDSRRVIRALEVWALTGRPISEWQTQWNRSAGAADERPRCGFWIDRPREELYARINARVRQMMAAGWLDEVQRLRQLPRPLSPQARQALGYQELFDHLDRGGDLETVVAQIQTRSRQFAKRQLTWFRHLPHCKPLSSKLTAASAVGTMVDVWSDRPVPQVAWNSRPPTVL
jgi:tRNA dimethylallyltransferase